MKPIILITIYRRYQELLKSLEHIRSLKGEFEQQPEIVVVWAAPIIGHFYFFEELIKEGKINHLVLRPRMDCDDGPTSRPESQNLRKGLEFISQNYGNEVYIVGQAGDIFVKSGIYKMVDGQIKNEPALLFFWQNGIANENAWHTNFFVIPNNKLYWPPISTEEEADTLEVQWGKHLARNNIPFYRSHNSRNQKFDEINFKQVPLALKGRKEGSSVNLYLIGYKKWYTKVLDFFKWFIFWR